MLVDAAAVKQALKRVGGKVPDHPSVTVKLGRKDARGQAEMTLTGDPYARPESVLRSLGISIQSGQVERVVRPADSQLMIERERAQRGVVSSEPKPRPAKAKPASPKPRYGRERGGS